MKIFIKSSIRKINNFFITKEKISYLLGRISAYTLFVANIIFINICTFDLLTYFLLVIIEICFLLSFYFNFYILKKYYK